MYSKITLWHIYNLLKIEANLHSNEMGGPCLFLLQIVKPLYFRIQNIFSVQQSWFELSLSMLGMLLFINIERKMTELCLEWPQK